MKLNNTDYKAKIRHYIDSIKANLFSISQTIHRNPELGLKEYKACELLTSKLRESGFQIDNPVAGIDTAFIATYESGKPGPRIGFAAEYDCVPELGHACGHNVIAAAAMGAALASKFIIEELGGSVTVFGTPDEEAVSPVSKGGKVIMVQNGIFDDVDVVLMAHPISGPNVVWDYTFPLKDFNVTYLGKPAHYTLPHEGINALESLLLFLNSVKRMQTNWRSGIMFAYTIVDGGGESPIIIPQKATAHIAMKAFYAAYLEETFSKVEQCADNVARIMGAKAEVKMISEYKNMIPNFGLIDLVYQNLSLLNAPVTDLAQSQRKIEQLDYPGASTDFADVSWVVPGIHWWCSIGDNRHVLHTPEFAEDAGSEAGNHAILLASKVMAMTAVDILTIPGCLQKIKEEFAGYKKDNFTEVPGIPPNYSKIPENR
ncbi:MAG: amidohydrolase [Candidatus Aminicenantes bacterium]|nr:amidohydrolase [Candidatus Aminicenantes bacterium]